jgi:O-antigen/teichoic acid export membrane protein
MDIRNQADGSAPRSLRANFSWTFAGNVIYAICNWATLVVLAKLGTPEIVGRFALGLAITAPVILFSGLQLRNIQATDAQRKFLFREYFGLRLVMCLLALLVIAGIIVASGFDPELSLIVLIIGIDKIADAVSDVIYGLLQQQEQMDRISKSNILKAVLSLVLLAIGQVFTHSLVWATAGWCLGSIVVMLFYDLRNGLIVLKSVSSGWDSLKPRFEIRTLSRLTWLALPLGITTLLISLNANIPRYFIENSSGERALGIFAAMAFLATAGTNVTSALGQSAVPRLAKFYAAGNGRAFRMLLLKLMGIAALLGVAGVLAGLIAGRPILALVYQPEYAAQNNVFVWLLAGTGVAYFASFIGYGTTAAHYFKLQPVILAVCAGSTFLGCALLVPSRGILGAAWAMLVAISVQLILMGVYLAHSQFALNRRMISSPMEDDRP